MPALDVRAQTVFENHFSFFDSIYQPVKHMEKELAPMNLPQFFSLLLGLTIIYQQYWVHPDRPKPQETIPSGHFQMDPVIVPYLFHRWNVLGFLLSHPLGFAYFVFIHFTPGQKQNHPAYLFICVDLTFFFTLW